MPEKDSKDSTVKDSKYDDWDDWDDDDDEEEDQEQTRGFVRMGFLDHLKELRSRLFKIIIAILLGIVITWNFVDPVWEILEGPANNMLKSAQEKSLDITKRAENLSISLPRFPEFPPELVEGEEAARLRNYLNDWRRDANKDLEGQFKDLLVAKDSKLMQTSITEAFFLKVKIAFMAGLVLMYPYLMFQVWAFVAPGLYKRERRVAFPFILFSTLFFIGGLVFGYYIAVPFAGTFLMSFGSEFVQLITVNKYMDFLITMMLGLGIVFEMPMAIFLLAKIGIATPRWLIRNFRYALIVIVAVAAVITPTGDPVNLAIFSIPMILLYGLGIGISAIWGPKDKKEDWDDDDDDDDDDDYVEPEDQEDEEDQDEGEAEARKAYTATESSDPEPYDDDDDDEGEETGEDHYFTLQVDDDYDPEDPEENPEEDLDEDSEKTTDPEDDNDDQRNKTE